jgi:hypothetical protein
VKRKQRELQRILGVLGVTKTAGGHYRLKLVTGEPIFTSSSPSDRRTMRNVKALVRRKLRA